MNSGLSLPDSTTPYAIYYVPINNDDRTGAKAVIDNLNRDAGHRLEADGKSASAWEEAIQRKENLRSLGLDQPSINYRGLDSNPLDCVYDVPKIHYGSHPGHGSGLYQPTFAVKGSKSGSIFHKYSTRYPQTLDHSAKKEGDLHISIKMDTGIITLQLDSNLLVADVIRRAIDHILTATDDQKNRYLNEYALFYGTRQLDLFKKLREYGLSDREVELIFKPKTSQTSTPSVEEPGIASINNIPKLSRQGYETVPSYMSICRMTDKELSGVENFTIKNHWGKIQFMGKTDIRGLNLDKIIVIEQGKVEIYPDDSDRPELGVELNKEALVTFYHYGIANKANFEQWLSKFKTKSVNIGAEYIGHDLSEDSITIQVNGSTN